LLSIRRSQSMAVPNDKRKLSLITLVGHDNPVGPKGDNVAMLAVSNNYRASNGICYRIEGEGEPLLLLHGLMVSCAMFDPLVELLRHRFRMLIPDLRGHGKSGDLAGPYDVEALTSDLDIVLVEASFDSCAVMGYSHGGAVAQRLAYTRSAVVRKLILACTYACSVATLRERIEVNVLLALL